MPRSLSIVHALLVQGAQVMAARLLQYLFTESELERVCPGRQGGVEKENAPAAVGGVSTVIFGRGPQCEVRG